MQTLMVSHDYTETPPKVICTLYPQEIQVYVPEAKLKLLGLLNDEGVKQIVEESRGEKQGDLFQK